MQGSRPKTLSTRTSEISAMPAMTVLGTLTIICSSPSGPTPTGGETTSPSKVLPCCLNMATTRPPVLVPGADVMARPVSRSSGVPSASSWNSAAASTGAFGTTSGGREIVAAMVVTSPGFRCTPTVVVTGSPSVGIARILSSLIFQLTVMNAPSAARPPIPPPMNIGRTATGNVTLMKPRATATPDDPVPSVGG